MPKEPINFSSNVFDGAIKECSEEDIGILCKGSPFIDGEILGWDKHVRLGCVFKKLWDVDIDKLNGFCEKEGE